jgi:class 3 adenylate cyclase
MAFNAGSAGGAECWTTAQSRSVDYFRGARVLEVDAVNVGRKAEHPPLPSGTVTFLLTDVEGSTFRWDRDPDGMAIVIDRHELILQLHPASARSARWRRARPELR